MHDFTLSVNALQFKIVGEKIHFNTLHWIVIDKNFLYYCRLAIIYS